MTLNTNFGHICQELICSQFDVAEKCKFGTFTAVTAATTSLSKLSYLPISDSFSCQTTEHIDKSHHFGM